MASSRYQIVAQLDPHTMQPIQQPQQPVVQPQQRYAVQPQDNSGAFNIGRFAAESAQDQMNWAASKGAYVTQDNFWDAQKEAWRAAAQAQQESAMQKQRAAEELKQKVEMSQFEESKLKRMSDAQIDSGAGYASAADTVMQLYRLHQDANNVTGYGNAVTGAAASAAYNLTDPRVRAYNSTLEGSLTNVARGVMGDTGVQASEPSAQKGVRDLLFNDGDNKAMGDVKAINLLQKVLTNMGDKIRGQNGNNINSAPLQDDYTRIYNQYKALVTGPNALSSQLEHPAASPDEIFGPAKTQAQYVAQGAQPLQPAVKAGVSQPSKDIMTAVEDAAAGKVPGAGYSTAQAFGGQAPEREAPWQLPQDVPASQQAQQAREVQKQQASQLPGKAVQAVGGAAGAALNWLGGLLPENWNPNTFQQQRLPPSEYPPQSQATPQTDQTQMPVYQIANAGGPQWQDLSQYLKQS